MAYKALLAFGLTDTGITLGALTVDALRDYATNADHATDWMVGATLENAGQGLYYLVLPAATSEGTVSVHVTADATKWADGVIETVGAIDAILMDTGTTLVADIWANAIRTLTATGTPSGSGASHDTITVNDALGNPVADCEVWITSDLDGTTIVAGPLVTNDDGTKEFLLDAGVTYYLFRRKAGMNFSNPASFVAAGD